MQRFRKVLSLLMVLSLLVGLLVFNASAEGLVLIINKKSRASK